FFHSAVGIRYFHVTGVQTYALPILAHAALPAPLLEERGLRIESRAIGRVEGAHLRLVEASGRGGRHAPRVDLDDLGDAGASAAVDRKASCRESVCRLLRLGPRKMRV